MRNVTAILLFTSAIALAPLPALAQTDIPEVPLEAPSAGDEGTAPATGAASDGAATDGGQSTENATAADGSAAPAQEPAAAPDAQTRTVASDGVAAIVQTLSPLVEDVQVVGPWREGDRNGVWRAVMARDPADPTKSQFFLQQIAASAGGAQIVRSTLVDEVGALGGAVLGYTADEPAEGQENSLTLFFEILPNDGEIAETYELRVQPDGSYDFGFASN